MGIFLGQLIKVTSRLARLLLPTKYLCILQTPDPLHRLFFHCCRNKLQKFQKPTHTIMQIYRYQINIFWNNLFHVKDSVYQRTGIHLQVINKFLCVFYNASYIGETAHHISSCGHRLLVMDKASYVYRPLLSSKVY